MSIDHIAGWRIEVAHGDVAVLRKVWTNTIAHSHDPSLSHVAGDFKRSWQVISDAGLYNYQIKSHHVYRVRVSTAVAVVH